MRVLALSHSAVVGAYREKFRILAARKGWDLHLVLPQAWPEGGSDVAAPAPGKEGKLQIHVLPVRLRGRVGFFTLKGLAKLAAELQPDILYVEEEPYSLNAWQALRAARSMGAALAFFTWENLDRRYKPPLNWVRRKVLQGASAAVAGNVAAAGLLRGWGFKGRLLRQPQYGVDTKRFRPALQRKKRSGFVVGYFGRLVHEKGVDLLVRAAASADIRLRIGGQGPEEDRLRALAVELGVQAEFTGFVPFEERQGFYHGLDALVLPSRRSADWEEQFGRVLGEAMACGVPCIGSDTGAIPEVLGKAGSLFSEGDSAALAALLKRWTAGKALRARLARLARARSIALFDEMALSQALGRFLEKVAAR